MSDSDWQDPFADDEAARERAARRAEREQRRHEREQSARESLGDRVREELDEPAESPVPPVETPGTPTAEPTSRAELPPRAEPPPADPRPRERAPAQAAEPGRTTTGGRPPRGAVRRRRSAALVGLGAMIVLVAGAGAVITRDGDDPAPAPTEPPRKTMELVIPEGYDRSQIAPVAKKAGIKGNYEKATRSTDQLNLNKLGAKGADSLEGFLFPATYEMFRGDKVEALVEKQLDAFNDHLANIDMSFAERKGLTPYDVVTIASMIEREIQVPEERELAASVMYNRLDANNPLGIDATIRFEDQNYDKPLLTSRLETGSPYNTHTRAGLPPGPIGNPGQASLEAAAKPAKTDFFYYVVKPGTCNEHEFVETQEEFNAASARYDAARDAAGGKSPTDC